MMTREEYEDLSSIVETIRKQVIQAIRKETAEKILAKYGSRFSPKELYEIMNEFGVELKHSPQSETEAKPPLDAFYDIQSCDEKLKCPHCEEYFYKSKIGFKVEDTERYFYCPQCGGRVLLK